MRVAEIIAQTKWLPGSESLKCGLGTLKPPKISILLPTFCRAADGYFERSVRSVLNQSLLEIELIIVDDASVDGTRELITQFMHDDARVSCLRHPRNVGLPAISEYEAYMKCRGEFVCFAFDDDEFLPQSLAQLLSQAEALNADIIHGHVDIHASNILTDEPFVIQHFGMAPTSQTHLASHNFFANNSVMLRRSVIENVGFYDPNIAVTRNCDWDLWLRISSQYRIYRVDVAMGKVSGPARKESLGRTYGLESYLSHEWTQLARNARLKPINFAEIDVQEIPESLSVTSKMALLELHQNFRNKFWYEQQTLVISGRTAVSGSDAANQFVQLSDGYVLVVVASFDATVILHFEHLQPRFRQRLRIVHALTFDSVIYEEVSGSSAIIFVRLLYPHMNWIECAKKLGIPHYYFLDDNFSELAKTPEFAEYLAPYDVENLALSLTSFTGVLLSTPALIDYFASHRIHSKLCLFPPISKRPVLASLAELPMDAFSTQPFTVLFFGGAHRVDAFKRVVLPALGSFSEVVPLRLIVVGAEVTENIKKYTNITLISRPIELAYDLLLGELMHYRIDVLAHPGEANPNNAFKNMNVLINAYHLKAIPLLSKVEPYAALQHGQLVYLAGSEEEWLAQFLHIFKVAGNGDTLSGEQTKVMFLNRLGAFIESEYSGGTNEKIIRDILDQSAFSGLLNRDQRSRLAMFQLRCKTQELEIELDAARLNVARLGQMAACEGRLPIAEVQKRGSAARIRGVLATVGAGLSARGYNRLGRALEQRFPLSEPYKSLPAAWSQLLKEEGLFDSETTMPTVFPSCDLSAIVFCEFMLSLETGILSAVEVPVEMGVRGVGVIGVELVDGNNVIEINQTQSLPVAATHDIVRFQFADVDLTNRGAWRIRVFVRHTRGAIKVPVCRVGGLLRPRWVLLAKYQRGQR